jgi:hypothetical protein
LSDLEVFDREELAAVFLTGFSVPVFPPSDVLRDAAESAGLIRARTTALQMAKKFETALDEPLLYALYSQLYATAQDESYKPEKRRTAAKR